MLEAERVAVPSLFTVPLLETVAEDDIVITGNNITSASDTIVAEEDSEAYPGRGCGNAAIVAEEDNEPTPSLVTSPSETTVAFAEILETRCTSNNGALDTDTVALRVDEPLRVVGPTAAGKAERGSSLIAPKPNMAYPLVNKQ